MANRGQRDTPLEQIDILLSGKMNTAIDATELGEGDMASLINMRYGWKSPRAILGMSKINTTPTAKTGILAGIHFEKDQPSESHVFVQAGDGTNSAVYDNQATIPNQGNFGSALWNDSAGAGTGRFCVAPDEEVIYCNNKDMVVFSGNESRCAGAVLASSAPPYTIYSDISQYVIAGDKTISPKLSASGASPYYLYIASTKTLSGIKLCVNTPNTNGAAAIGVNYWNAGAWNAVSSLVDGTASGGKTMAQTGFVTFTDTSANAKPSFVNGLYFYWYQIKFTSIDAATSINYVTTQAQPQSLVDLWDGTPRSLLSFLTYSGTTGLYYDGTVQVAKLDFAAGVNTSYVDLANFNSDGISYIFAGSAERLTALQFYFPAGRNNTNAVNGASLSVYYWNGSAWTAVAGLVDNTAVTIAGPKTMLFNRSGLVSWDAPAYGNEIPTDPRNSGNAPLYYYKIVPSTQLNNVIASGPGVIAGVAGQIQITGTNTLFNSQVAVGDSLTISGQTYTIASVASDTVLYLSQPLAVGGSFGQYTIGMQATGTVSGTAAAFTVTGVGTKFTTEAKAGSKITIAGDATTYTVQSVANDTSLTLANPLGTTPAGAIYTTSFTGNGSVSGAAGQAAITGVGTNFTTQYTGTVKTLNGLAIASVNSDTSITMSSVLAASIGGYGIIADVALDYVTGATAQKKIVPRKFAITWQNRVVLANDLDVNRNAIDISAVSAPSVFNGADTARYYFGDRTDIVAAASLFARFSSALYESLVVCKRDSTWMVDGSSPADYVIKEVSTSYGCVAPQTMVICDVGYEIVSGLNKHVCIWLSATGIVMFDLNTLLPIDFDVSNYFDPSKPEYINESLAATSVAWFDERNKEYHINIPSGAGATGLNAELVFDLIKKKWFTVNRGTGNSVQCAWQVSAVNGNKYVYAGLSNGYVERLENGTTFDGAAITASLRTKDYALGGWMLATGIRAVKLLAVAKANTANLPVVNYYPDCATNPVALNKQGSSASAFTVANSSGRVAQSTQGRNEQFSTFHAFGFSMTTNNENCGAEPIGFGVLYQKIREEIK